VKKLLATGISTTRWHSTLKRFPCHFVSPKPSAARFLKLLREAWILSILQEGRGGRVIMYAFDALLCAPEGTENVSLYYPIAWMKRKKRK